MVVEIRKLVNIRLINTKVCVGGFFDSRCIIYRVIKSRPIMMRADGVSRSGGVYGLQLLFLVCTKISCLSEWEWERSHGDEK